jgi:hypothetical protein
LKAEFSPRFHTILLVDQVPTRLIIEKWAAVSCSKPTFSRRIRSSIG